MTYSDYVLILPNFYNDSQFFEKVDCLIDEGFSNLICVDCNLEKKEILESKKSYKENIKILSSEKKLKKGEYLKFVFSYIKNNFSEDLKGIITISSFISSTVQDLKLLIENFELSKNALVLGCRKLKEKSSLSEKFEKWFYSLFYKFASGKKCSDSQSDFRIYPLNILDLALSEEGENYDYEMNLLMDISHICDVKECVISTHYEKNSKSPFFNKYKDSINIFIRFIKFTLSSMTSSLVDYAVFLLLVFLLAFMPKSVSILLATFVARVCSALTNFIINRKWSFNNKTHKSVGKELFRFGVVFIVKILLSSGFVYLLSRFNISLLILKIFVDTLLFFLSYTIQRNWVFLPPEAE